MTVYELLEILESVDGHYTINIEGDTEFEVDIDDDEEEIYISIGG